MECEKCGDKGFTEEQHGLVMVLCDCEKAREVAEAQGMGGILDDNTSDNRTGPIDSPIGGTNPRKSKQSRKQKTRKKA